MLPFPYSFLLLPMVAGLGVAYVFAARLPRPAVRIAVRGGILAATFVAPGLTSGPGPAQLILGLLVGYLGLRMVALAQRRPHDRADRDLNTVVLDVLSPAGLLQPAATPIRRPGLVTLAGCAGILACIGLLVLGNGWRLWQMSRLGHFLDDQLVVLEVAVGVAGVHAVITGAAGLMGYSVSGLMDHPFGSTSLSEFWGRRWNRVVQSTLADGFFRPLARQGFPTMGLFAAFAASGVFHVLAVLGAGSLREVAWPCAGVLWAFLGHGLAVWIEQRLGWDERPATPSSQAIARARTLLLFLALSPGFIEPLAAVAGVHGRTLAVSPAEVQSPMAGRGCNVAGRPAGSQ